MEHDPMSERPHEERPRAENPGAVPPPPPPPPPRPAATYPIYGPPVVAPPPRRPLVWRILSTLVGLSLLLLVLFFILGIVLAALDGSAVIALGGDRIGLLRIEGAIYQGEDKEFWIKTLDDFARNRNIKGVLIRIDSPGGTVGASQELYQAVMRLRKNHKKPVYISMGDVAASGGYYTAAAADRIYALKGTLTGSIGVIFDKPDITSLTQKLGIRTEVVKSGKMKDAGDFMRSMTPEEREFFNSMILNTYSQFVDDVLAARGGPLGQALKAIKPEQWQALHLEAPDKATPEDYLRRIADGRVYTGSQALQLGLIDEIGTLEDVKAALGNKLGLGSRPSIYEAQSHKGLSGMLRSRIGDLLPASRSPLQYMMRLP